MLKTYNVAVFRTVRPGRKDHYSAYTLWYNTAWSGFCGMFTVEAKTGQTAKRIAIRAAKEIVETQQEAK